MLLTGTPTFCGCRWWATPVSPGRSCSPWSPRSRRTRRSRCLARISTQPVRGKGSADFVAQGAVVPPGDGGVGGEAGLAEDGCVGAPVEADGDRVGGGG